MDLKIEDTGSNGRLPLASSASSQVLALGCRTDRQASRSNGKLIDVYGVEYNEWPWLPEVSMTMQQWQSVAILRWRVLNDLQPAYCMFATYRTSVLRTEYRTQEGTERL